jgi:anti-sigma-K factor RskA
MRHDDPKLIDALAAEYALGTLRGAARARFERWRAESWHVERRVRAWEERLAPLALAVQPIEPSAHVWPQIERRISADARSVPARRRGLMWRAVAATLVVVAVALGIWRALHTPQYQLFAMIEDERGAMAWKLEMDPENHRLRMSTMPGAPRRPDRSFELWALPDEGMAPVSLGMLPDAGRAVQALSQDQMQALDRASKVAVSLEPRGGSPTGSPTGPVLYVAERALST